MFDKKKEEHEPQKKPAILSGNLMDKFRKFGLSKFVCALAAGILLLLFLSEIIGGTTKNTVKTTDFGSKSTQKIQNNTTTDEYISDLENRLKQMLMKVEDVGDVEVMITVKSSKESVILKDENSQEETTEEEDSAGGSRKSSSKTSQDETVLQQSESGGSSPYTVKELEPEIEGILVIAEGGNSEVVKSDVVAAVQTLFNVPVHKIKVMKMNQ